MRLWLCVCIVVRVYVQMNLTVENKSDGTRTARFLDQCYINLDTIDMYKMYVDISVVL